MGTEITQVFTCFFLAVKQVLQKPVLFSQAEKSQTPQKNPKQTKTTIT